MAQGTGTTGETPQYLVTVAVLVIDTATGSSTTATAQRRTYVGSPLWYVIGDAADDARATAMAEVESA